MRCTLKTGTEPSAAGILRDRCFEDSSRYFQERLERFVARASGEQLKSLEKLIALRKAKLVSAQPIPRKRGRPREEDNPLWIESAREVAWARHIEKKRWDDIAEAQGISKGKVGQRTLSRRRDDFAEIIYDRLWGFGVSEKSLTHSLNRQQIRIDLQKKFSIPFETHPTKSAKLVRTLFPIGAKSKRGVREIATLIKSQRKSRSK